MVSFRSSHNYTVADGNNSELTTELLERYAPAIFASAPQSGVSKRYNQVKTVDVIDGLRKEGWKPTWVSQSRVRQEYREGFQKHMIKFRHSDDIGTTRPEMAEIVMVNSHDRSSSFQIHAGVFRLICANGMILADETFAKLRVNHMADADAVIGEALRVPTEIPRIMDNIDSMKRCDIGGYQLALAEAAMILRWGSVEDAPIKANRLLQVNRRGDEGTDLWRTFNRVQEGVIRGGQRYISQGGDGNLRRGTVRPVKGLDENTKLNKALWHLAESMKSALA